MQCRHTQLPRQLFYVCCLTLGVHTLQCLSSLTCMEGPHCSDRSTWNSMPCRWPALSTLFTFSSRDALARASKPDSCSSCLACPGLQGQITHRQTNRSTC